MRSLSGYVKICLIILILIILKFVFCCFKNGEIVKEVVTLNDNWQYANFSVINTGEAILYRSNKLIKKNKIIAINAGHGTIFGEKVETFCHPDKSPKVTGGSTDVNFIKATAVSKGTVFLNGVSEAEINLLVAQNLRDMLLAYGYDVLMLRDGMDVQLDNVARTVIANNIADIYISIHFDDTSNDKGAFYISVPLIESYINMYPVSKYYKEHNKLGEFLIKGLREVDVKINDDLSLPLDLTQTSYSTIPSVVIELGDKKSNIDDEYLEKYAFGLFCGIKKYFE